MTSENRYASQEIRDRLASGTHHRQIVGGLWDELGPLQLRYLQEAGHKSYQTLLDIGCGSLRGGHHFVDWLAPASYYGFDISEELLELGYRHELTDAQRVRLPRSHLHAAEDFLFPNHWPVVQGAIAVSLFTHLGASSFELCLRRLQPRLAPGGVLHGTVFTVDDAGWTKAASPAPDMPQLATYPNRDPYHYTPDMLQGMARRSGFALLDISEFGHPRGQRMARFQRQADTQKADTAQL